MDTLGRLWVGEGHAREEGRQPQAPARRRRQRHRRRSLCHLCLPELARSARRSHCSTPAVASTLGPCTHPLQALPARGHTLAPPAMAALAASCRAARPVFLKGPKTAASARCRLFSARHSGGGGAPAAARAPPPCRLVRREAAASEEGSSSGGGDSSRAQEEQKPSKKRTHKIARNRRWDGL